MKKIFSFLIIVFALVFALVSPVIAQDDQAGDPLPPVRLENPLGNSSSPQLLIGRVITTILGVVGSLALLMFVYGGITWMTSSGSPEKVKKGRDILVWAVIGLAIIFFSYAIVNFVIFDVVSGS